METRTGINVIPKPAYFQLNEIYFTINSETKIYFNQKNNEIKAIANYLAEIVNRASGFQLAPSKWR